MNGAPYDIFLAADGERPQRLADEGFGTAGGPFVYAIGKLSLCGPGLDFTDPAAWLASDKVRRIAIANPRHAPYGQAAMQLLDELGVREEVQDKLVMAENINQTLQFLLSRNVDAAFIARSQRPSVWGACTRNISDARIIQQGILLNDSGGARAFKQFLQGPQAAAIIEQAGYEVSSTQQE